MATNSTFTSIYSIRRGIVVIAACLALAACGGDPETTASGQVIFDSSTPEPVEVTVVTETPTTTAPVETTSTVPETSTTAAPITTTTTTEAPATVIRPEQVGAVASNALGFMVVTADDDPLNVRLGPGVQYDAINQLPHRTTGINTTYTVELASSGPWALVEVDGEELGWVHAGFLEPFGHTATCSRFGPTAVENETLVLASDVDVDQDGALDHVQVFTGQLAAETAWLWVEIAFANGGHTFGVAAQANSVLHFPGVYDMHVGRLQYLPHDGPLEITLTTAQGASHSFWNVLTIEQCQLVNTTIDGQHFGYGIGASAIASSAGCSFGAHGELTFSTSITDFNGGTQAIESYALRGTEWELIESWSVDFDPTQEFESALKTTNCFG